MGFCIGIIIGIIDILTHMHAFNGFAIGTIFFVCLWTIILWSLIGGAIEYIWKIIKHLIKK